MVKKLPTLAHRQANSRHMVEDDGLLTLVRDISLAFLLIIFSVIQHPVHAKLIG